MKKTLFGFIWHFSMWPQILILAITVLSFPLVYMSLEVPKWIVNDAIDNHEFPKQLWGFSFEQIPYLVVLCMIFLALVVANNVIKYVLNLYKGVIGERMLRRLRHQLYFQILRFRPAQFRRVSSGELIPMITAEVEDLGGFIGDAVAVPAFQGGTLLVYLFFIFMQDPMLGFAAISLYPVQAYIIPKLQRRVIILSRDRIKNVRRISDRIGESVGGTIDMHANDTASWHLANISDRLFENYVIRFEIYKRKYMIKFVNNFMNQLPPFLFYLIGGILVIEGTITFGALVAVLAAYKDLASPWKELLDYYQNMANVQVKYETIVENFDPPEVYPVNRLTADPPSELTFDGHVVVSHLVAGSNASKPEVRDVSLDIPNGAHVVVAGLDGGGRTELLSAIVGLAPPISGHAAIGGQTVEQLPESVLGRRTTYVGPAPYVFNDSLRSNLLYALRYRPLGPPPLSPDEIRRRNAEASATGSTPFDFLSPWEDLTAAGVASAEEMDAAIMAIVEDVGLGNDVYRMGLQARVDPEAERDLVDRILAARAQIAGRLAEDRKLADLVELWDRRRIIGSASLAENVLFGLPVDPSTPVAAIPQDPKVMQILGETGLLDPLVELGAKVAETMVELFSQMRSDDAFVGAYSLLAAEELPAYEQRLKRLRSNTGKISTQDRADFIGLAFRIVPARHRVAEIPEALEKAIIAARATFRDRLFEEGGAYVPFDPKIFIPPLTIEDNVLFGKVRVDRRGGRERIDAFVRDTVMELGLRGPVSHAGLAFQVGVAGSRLSSGQRRRIGIARALLKRPLVAIFDDVIDDSAVMSAVRRRCEGRTLIVGASNPAAAPGFESYYLMSEGRLVAEGSYDSVLAAFEQDGNTGGAEQPAEPARELGEADA